MVVREKGEYTISISQKDNIFNPKNSDIEYSRCRLVVAKRTSEVLNYVMGVTGDN